MTDPVAVPQLTLFLMSEKGYRVLQHIVAHPDKSIIALVVGARDEQMAQGFFVEIQALCAHEGITFRSRNGAGPPFRLMRWPFPDAG